MAADLEASVGPGRVEQLAARAVARAFSTPARRRRSLVAALAGASFALAGVTALGAFADGAAPGQILYPVDRVFESAADLVGISRDRSAERLEELIRVIDRGDQDTAVRFLPEVVVAVERRTGVTVPAPITPQARASTPTGAQSAAVEDPVVALKLAAEALLQGVRSAATDGSVDLEAAATDLYVVAGQLGSEPEPAIAVEATTTTLDDSLPEPEESTTTTTAPGEVTTTTTSPGGSQPEGEPSTTTTTLPPTEDGGGDDAGGDPGPIILPPLP